MITLDELKKCIDYLSLLASKSTRNDRQLLIEIGVILQKEINRLENNMPSVEPHNRQIQLEMEKLLADNQQLYAENERLLNSVKTLSNILEEKIPQINLNVNNAVNKLDVFINQLHAL